MSAQHALIWTIFSDISSEQAFMRDSFQILPCRNFSLVPSSPAGWAFVQHRRKHGSRWSSATAPMPTPRSSPTPRTMPKTSPSRSSAAASRSSRASALQPARHAAISPRATTSRASLRETEARTRPDRHSRAQCRRRYRGRRRQARSERRGEHQGGRCARGAGAQSALHHPDLPGGRAGHDGAETRPHRHARLGRRFQGAHPGLDLCGVEGRRDPLHAMPGRPAPSPTTSPSIASRPGIPEPAASSARARWTPTGWSRPARSTASRPSTRSRASSSSSQVRWAPSSPARCCGSTAAGSAGRAETSRKKKRAAASGPFASSGMS